jgi:acyl-coenzyme A thioesterase PaaI-like protein
MPGPAGAAQESDCVKPSRLRHVMNWWPPFLFSGIRVEALSDDWRFARVRLKLRWYNRNYVRTHFGGALFAMTDPFWMIMTMEALKHEYVVWDKAATIEFIAPGREDVYAEFLLDDSVLDELRAATTGGEKYLRWFEVGIKTARGEMVARVRKQVYVRRKRTTPASADGN